MSLRCSLKLYRKPPFVSLETAELKFAVMQDLQNTSPEQDRHLLLAPSRRDWQRSDEQRHECCRRSMVTKENTIHLIVNSIGV